jgi:hypothetical protein
MSMLTRILGALMAFAIPALFTGCLIRHGDFTVISNKLIRTTDFELSKAAVTKGVKGEDVTTYILGIPMGRVAPTLEEAIDDGLRKGGGDVMTDAVVEFWMWDAILVAQRGWSVEGDVVKTRGN